MEKPYHCGGPYIAARRRCVYIYVAKHVRRAISGTSLSPKLCRPARLTSHLFWKHKEAIVVLATSTKWLPQLALMSYTLERHSPLRDRVILVPKQYRDSGFPAAGLDILRQRLGWKVRWVEHIAVPRGPKGEQTPGRYKDVMNKIHIFNMTEYAAVAFLDLDGLVVGSLDEAFSALRGSGSKFASVGDATLAKEQVTLAVQAGCESLDHHRFVRSPAEQGGNSYVCDT